MKTYFFGVIRPGMLGHYLYSSDGTKVYNEERASGLPFKFQILDGGLLPPQLPQDQARHHLSVINDWTIITMWDRTGDHRGGSSASFVADGVYTLEEMKEIALQAFPEQWARIHAVTT
jgi:hypothetical protein